ncbi:MAG: tyrosine-type recombinase/integrase [Chloroflexi bacterium]|nr:tyrosine-type recombinase/integrase [Chloroflexota bacterium]
MTDTTSYLPQTYLPPDWEGAVRAFLAEKQARSGSHGTAREYARLLARFFGPLDETPDAVTPDEVFTFAYGKGPSGREPSAATIGLRLAAVSSLYAFLIRMGLLDRNPADKVQRPRAEPSPPRGLDKGEIKALLAAIPNTPVGKRDKALILTFLFTGRRRSEILDLCIGDLSRNAGVFYAYRSKGGKVNRRELPEPCFRAIVEALAARGKEIEGMADDEPLFDVSPHGFYLNLQRYFRNAKLPPAGVHVLRHTAAKLRRDVGESVEDVSRFLDHANLAVTTTYLRRLEGEQDTGWRKVAALLA